MLNIDTLNFNSLCEEYLLYSKGRHKKQGFDTLTRNFKLHIIPYFKDKNICNLTKSDIIDWQTNIINENYSNSFNRTLYYNFSSFMNYCVNKSYIKENLVLCIDKFPKKVEKKGHNIYTIWEFRKFRHYLGKYVIKQYFNFMFFYGTRPSEAMALRFSDIEGLCCNIEHSIQRRGNRELDTPKNQSSLRTIKISLLMWLRFYKLKRYYIKQYGTFDRNYFIFGGQKPLSTTTIDRYKEKACNRAKMEKITQHEFRHSCATRLIHKHKPIDYVSRKLGHSKVSTTVDIYLHKEKRMHKHSLFRINF